MWACRRSRSCSSVERVVVVLLFPLLVVDKAFGGGSTIPTPAHRRSVQRRLGRRRSTANLGSGGVCACPSRSSQRPTFLELSQVWSPPCHPWWRLSPRSRPGLAWWTSSRLPGALPGGARVAPGAGDEQGVWRIRPNY
jgi:hypothetical protein